VTRVVVTGLGPVTPIGVGLEAFVDGLRRGVSGVGPLTRFDPTGFGSRIAGELRGFDPAPWLAPGEQATTDRCFWYAAAAVELALADAVLERAALRGEGAGIALGNAVGGAEFAERELRRALAEGAASVSPHLHGANPPGAVLASLRRRFGCAGPSLALSTGCTAGTDAIGEAARCIQRGEARVMLAGGADAPLTPALHASFDVIGALSCRNDAPEKASRPFAAGRDGFVMAEGAAFLVLESLEHARARRAPRVYAEVRGFAATSNAHHMTAPDPEPRQNLRALQLALARAGVTTRQVDYVNAHGSATRLNDVTETRLFKALFGARAELVPTSSTKSQIGHMLGAAGAAEAMACVLAMRHGFLPPTINLDEADPECDLDWVANAARPARVDVALSNACAFGGLNSALVLTGGLAR
jgi:3-oxoacyl-[acyl-carrier-protein] synthase II